MPSSLPQELIDHIIEELGTDDDTDPKVNKLALQACSQASWSLRIPSRKILFSEINLIEDTERDAKKHLTATSKLRNFSQILEHDLACSYPGLPTLASHVQSLTVQLTRARSQSYSERYSVRPAPTTTSILSTILPLLKHVEKFTLKTAEHLVGNRPHTSSWQFVDDAMKASILNLCKSPTIITIRVFHIERLPSNLFTDCPHLKFLSLYGVEGPDRHLPSSWLTSSAESQPWTPTLQTLLIKTSGEMASLLSEIHRFDEFKSRPPSFLASVWKMDVSSHCRAGLLVEWMLIQAVSELSLRHLRISDIRCMLPHVTGFPGVVDFGILKKLEILELQGIFAVRDQGIRIFRYWTAFDERSDLATAASIHTLIFDLDWVGCQQGDEENIFDPRHGWLTIDSALSGARFPLLKTVCLRLHITYLPISVIGTTVNRLQELISHKVNLNIIQLFPTTCKSKSIQLAVTVKSSHRTM